MLISFSVSNFKSISEKQTLSFEASSLKGDDKKENMFNAEYKSKSNKMKQIDLLKSVVFYGANASGKSNFLDAFQFFISNIKYSFGRGFSFPNEEDTVGFTIRRSVIPTTFRLLEEFETRTTTFEVVFLNDEHIKYKYILEIDLNKKIIVKETAFYSPKGQETLLFERGLKNIDLKSLLISKEAEEAIITSLKENENSLLVSILEKFGIKKSLPISRFSNFFSFVKNHRSFYPSDLFENKDYKNFVIDLLQKSVDKNICDIVNDEKNKKQRGHFFYRHSIYIVRKNCEGNKKFFSIMEESDGTRKIFEFSRFLYHLINKKDKTIIVFDKFDNYLHPALMEFLLKFI